MTGPHHYREAEEFLAKIEAASAPCAKTDTGARQRIPGAERQLRDWVQVTITALPGLAAVIALIFSYLAVKATGAQLQITEQGQITDRYNAAITNLGSASTDIRLGGIYALQRIMQDSPRDQSTTIAVLCAYVRDHAPASTTDPRSSTPSHLGTDVQAALTVIGSRPSAHEHLAAIDLNHTQLVGAVLTGDLTGADLSSANLARADLTGADLARVHLDGAGLARAHLSGADLSGARLDSADLAGADLVRADLTGADLTGANLTGAGLAGANLTGVGLDSAALDSAALNGATLTNATLNGATLNGATLTRVYLSNADLSGADLSGAKLTNATLNLTNLTGANLNGTDLTGARLIRDNLAGANLVQANFKNTNVCSPKGIPFPVAALPKASSC